MLAIQKSTSNAQKCTPNLLPCKINHDGPVNASERYWKPETVDGKQTPLNPEFQRLKRWQTAHRQHTFAEENSKENLSSFRKDTKVGFFFDPS